MPDIFSRNTDSFGSSFAADAATLTFPAVGATGGDADVGLLVQNLNMSYTQNVTRLYEVGQPTIYYVGGRTQGQSAIGRVVGPRSISAQFYRKYGDICEAANNSLNFAISTGCDNGARVAYTCLFVVITTIGISVAAADMLINEQVQMIFSSLRYDSLG